MRSRREAERQQLFFTYLFLLRLFNNCVQAFDLILNLIFLTLYLYEALCVLLYC
jgi:hypothetical protein